MGRSARAPILAALAAAALLAGAALLGRGDSARAPGGSNAGGSAGEEAETAEPSGAADGGGQSAEPDPGAAGGAGDVPADLLAAPAVRAAAARAARDAGVPIEAVTIADVGEVTWPSSALGCPEQGGMYLQVLTPGYRVTTVANGTRRVYHTDRGGEGRAVVVSCAPALVKPGALDLPPARLDAVRADAASRALEPGEPIELVAVALSTATTLTCDELGAAVGAPGPGPGSGSFDFVGELIWDVTLRVGFRQHRYRVSGTGLVHCGQAGVDADGNPID